MSNQGIEVVVSNEDHLEFLIWGFDIGIINGLRRTMIDDIPVWGIDEIIFFKNTTIMPDEILAERMYLVPIRVIDDEITTEYKLTLHSIKDGEEIQYITADEFKGTSSNILIPIKNIPLMKACKGQELHVEAFVRKGTGRDHSRWCPVSTCFYRKEDKYPNCYRFIVETNGGITPKELLLMAVSELKNIMIGSIKKMKIL